MLDENALCACKEAPRELQRHAERVWAVLLEHREWRLSAREHEQLLLIRILVSAIYLIQRMVSQSPTTSNATHSVATNETSEGAVSSHIPV